MKKIIYFFLIMFMSLITPTVAAQAAEYLYAASSGSELSLYISPDEKSCKVTPVPACSRLELIEKENTWGLVNFENKCGWINLSFTRDDYNTAAEASGNDNVKNVKVNSHNGKASLYNVPSTLMEMGSEVKYEVPDGTVLRIMRETSDGWGLVSMNDEYAWILIENTQPYVTQTEQAVLGNEIYYVYALSDEGKGVELYTNLEEKNLCAVIPDCVKLTVRERRNNYAYVSYDGINGWIDLAYTVQSLAAAQINAGVEVNTEYEITQDADMLTVPSDNTVDGGSVVGSVNAGENVYVMRATLNGWYLINVDGVLGWIAPGCALPAQAEYENTIIEFDKKVKGYVATEKERGATVYSFYDAKKEIACIPECTKVDVIAEKDGYKYVYCGYAAGWVNSLEIVDSYESALLNNIADEKWYYVTSQTTGFMSLPTELELCGSEKLSVIEEKTYFEVIRTVTTGDTRWALAEIGGKKGWINLSYAKKAISLFELAGIISLAVLAIAAVILVVVMIIRKRKSAKKSIEGKKRIREFSDMTS